jgi:hypothetical protein
MGAHAPALLVPQRDLAVFFNHTGKHHPEDLPQEFLLSL